MAVLRVIALLICTSLLASVAVVGSAKVTVTKQTKVTEIYGYIEHVISKLECWFACTNLDATCHHVSYNENQQKCGKSSALTLYSHNTETDEDWCTLSTSGIMTEDANLGSHCSTTLDCTGINAVCATQYDTNRYCLCKPEFKFNTVTGQCDTECRLSTTLLVVKNGYIRNFHFNHTIIGNIESLSDCSDQCVSKYGENYVMGARFHSSYNECVCKSVTFQQVSDGYPTAVIPLSSSESGYVSATRVCE